METETFRTVTIVFSIPENFLVGISGALAKKESPLLSKNVLWENSVGYLRNGECESFHTFAIVISTPENLLVEISGALGTKENDSQQKCVLWKCCGVFQKWWKLELSNFCHCVQHTWKLISSRDYWSSRNTKKPLSKLKHVYRKCTRVSQKQWMLELSNLCHCVQPPWQLTSRDFWSPRNERKPLSKLICLFWKCCGVSEKC